MNAPAGDRIAKVMARAGLCSRREAERWIEEGRVTVNGKIIKSPALNITAADEILVNGEPLKAAEKTRLWLFHKPRGCITSHSDPEKRPTVFSLLPKEMPYVVSIGRLDFNSEGLLLLTNDGALAHHLENPKTGWKRRYRVRAFGHITEQTLKSLQKGLTVTDHKKNTRIKYGPIEASVENKTGRNSWMIFTLTEGKNRGIRHVCEHLGWQVNRLIRIAYGPFQLGALKPNEVKEITGKALHEQLGDWQEQK